MNYSLTTLSRQCGIIGRLFLSANIWRFMVSTMLLFKLKLVEWIVTSDTNTIFRTTFSHYPIWGSFLEKRMLTSLSNHRLLKQYPGTGKLFQLVYSIFVHSNTKELTCTNFTSYKFITLIVCPYYSFLLQGSSFVRLMALMWHATCTLGNGIPCVTEVSLEFAWWLLIATRRKIIRNR